MTEFFAKRENRKKFIYSMMTWLNFFASEKLTNERKTPENIEIQMLFEPLSSGFFFLFFIKKV